MSTASSVLAALCDELQTALSDGNIAQILSICKQLEPPSTALINERAALLSSSHSVEADEAARPLLYTLQLLLQCSQLTGSPHTVAHVLFTAVRGICTTGSMQHYLTAAASASHGGQLLYAIVHQLVTTSTPLLEELSKLTVPALLISPQEAGSSLAYSPIIKDLRICRIYLQPLLRLIRAYPTFFHSQLPSCVLLCTSVLCEIVLLPPSNPHRRLSLRDYFYNVHDIAVAALHATLASSALHFIDKCELLDNLFPAFLLDKDDISAAHAAALLYTLSSLLQSTLSPTKSQHGLTAQRVGVRAVSGNTAAAVAGGTAVADTIASSLPADVVERLFHRELPLLMTLLPRAHPYALLRDNLPPTVGQKNQNGATHVSSAESDSTQQLGKVLDNCSMAVCNLLTSVLAQSTNSSSSPPTLSPLPFSPPSFSPSSPPDTAALVAVRSFLWRHLLSRQPLVSRLTLMLFVHAIPRWGTTFRVQTLQAAQHVLRMGERPLEELWRLDGVEAVSDLLSAIFPLLTECEQQMLWGSLSVVDGLIRLAADCDVVVAFDVPPSTSQLANWSQSSSQSLTPTQTLSASPSASSQWQSQSGGGIPLCLAVRLLYRTHLNALHSSTRTLVGETLIRLLIAYTQCFSGAERIGTVEQLSLLLYTFNLLEWLLTSPDAFSSILNPAQQRDLTTKVAAALVSLLRVASASSDYAARDFSRNQSMTFIDRLLNCSPLLQQRLLLAVLGLLDTLLIVELSSAQLLRLLQGVTVIADRWPSIRWRLPPLLLRVCGSPIILSTATAAETVSAHLGAIVTLWRVLLQRPPTAFTSSTDVLCFSSAIARLFDSTKRLAHLLKAESATLLPSNSREEVLQQLREWQLITQSPQPLSPSDEQWSVMQSQRHIVDELTEQSSQQSDVRAMSDECIVVEGVKSEPRVEMEGGVYGVSGTSRYLHKLGELMQHNVRSRDIARVLLQARSRMSEEEWRQVKATMRDDEAEWISLFNAVNAVV